jgi:hypothetical protein
MLFSCVLALSVLSAAGATETGMAYDQISTLYLFGAGTPPAPGSFAADQAAVGDQTTIVAGASDFPPVAGQPVPSFATMARFTHGLLYHVSHLGTLSRVDDPATKRATIARPDRGQVIYLDLSAKTYRLVSGAAATALLDPAQTPNSVQTPVATGSAGPEQSTVMMTLSRNEESIDGATIDGVATHGLKTIVTVTATSADSSCTTVDAKTTYVRYVDPSRDEPAAHNDFAAASNFLKAMPTSKCRYTFAPGSLTTPAPSTEDAHFALYTRADSELTVPSLAAPVKSTMLVERGNVRTLSDADLPLFEIPDGFKAAPGGP